MASAVGKPVDSIHPSPLQRAAEVRRSAGLVCRPLKRARKLRTGVPTAKAVGYGSCADGPDNAHDHGSRTIDQHEFIRSRAGEWEAKELLIGVRSAHRDPSPANPLPAQGDNSLLPRDVFLPGVRRPT